MVATCTLIFPASHETEHLPPVLVATEKQNRIPELELSWTVANVSAVGLWQTCTLLRSSKPRVTILARRLHSVVISLIGLDKRPASLIKHGRSMPGSENYAPNM